MVSWGLAVLPCFSRPEVQRNVTGTKLLPRTARETRRKNCSDGGECSQLGELAAFVHWREWGGGGEGAGVELRHVATFSFYCPASCMRLPARRGKVRTLTVGPVGSPRLFTTV